jgi:hypothetical protein
MGGGGGFGGVSGSGELLAANAVYTVEVSADAADLDSIDSYFTGNRVAVVEDSRQAEVTRGVLRRLSGLSGAIDDAVVLQQADKRMLARVQTSAGQTIAPQEVAYLVEGTPEQIAELVSATGAIPEPIEPSEQSFDLDRDTASGGSRQQLSTERESAEGQQQDGQAREGNATRRSRGTAGGQRGSSAEKTDGSASDDLESADGFLEERVPKAEEQYAPAAAAATEADREAFPGGQPSGAEARRFFVRAAREAAATDSPQVPPPTDAAPVAMDETAEAAATADADPAEVSGASQEESADPGPPPPAPAEGERPTERPQPPPEGLEMLDSDEVETRKESEADVEAAVPLREDLPRTAPRDVALDHLAEELPTEEYAAGEHRVRVWFVFRVAPQPAAPAGQPPDGESPAQPDGAPPGDSSSP